MPSSRPWVMSMRWHDLLFMHWPVKPEALRHLIPSALELDTFDGKAWLGVVPFRMSRVRARWTPPIPWLSGFPELNVRTYVKGPGKPGVWFFSLDAARKLAVRAARWSYHLPYYDAKMSVRRARDEVRYRSTRTHRGAAPAQFIGRYQPIGPVYRSKDDSIDAFVTERYCLYAAAERELYRGDIHHARWPLQEAEAEIETNTMLDPLGLKLPQGNPLLHFARRLDVVAWRLVPLA